MMQTNNPALRSWRPVPEDSDFPIQNLPIGVFKYHDHICAGMAIGDDILRLDVLQEEGLFNALSLPRDVFKQQLNHFFSLGRKKCGAVRERVSDLLQFDEVLLQDNPALVARAFVPRKAVTMMLPVHVPNYTDFYSSEEHATNVGAMFRDPAHALLPNWKHLPVGYHGRASSIVVSGTNVHRPKGQIKLPEQDHPIFSPTHKLDFELEVAFITGTNTTLGESISTAEAEHHIIGLVLFNDWSARDIQQWEYAPLGPFLGKNFGSTISPWVIFLDALEPFRVDGPMQEPAVLPYLSYSGQRNIDINLEVSIRTMEGDEGVVCKSNTKYLYWNMAQQLAHHTVNGCNVCAGDVFASGTISGPTPDSFGSMLELSWNGKKALDVGGHQRRFIEDGDTVVMKGWAERNGVRIGFGVCEGTILPAL